jgi:hypothetical protein
MTRGRRIVVSTATIDKPLKDERRQAKGVNCVPLLFPLKEQVTCAKGWHVVRSRHLLSNLEYRFFFKLEYKS